MERRSLAGWFPVALALASCAPAHDACTHNEECVLAYEECPCGGSGGPIIAVRADHRTSFQLGRCGLDYGTCSDECICWCYADTRHVATCRSGRCEAVYLPDTGLSACTTTADCVRRGQTCCSDPAAWPECRGGPSGPVAVARTRVGGLDALICDPGSTCARPTLAERVACVRGVCTAEEETFDP